MVLLTGPSGCGKTALARVIHDNSPRRNRPFLAENCANLTPDRVQADLFGAVPGAYTGQVGRKRGLVEVAAGGTLFLDEVGELPPESQAQLLLFLQDKRYRQFGGVEQHTADVRIIAASSAPLTDPSRFRPDLYNRLAQKVIPIPPLAERLDDLPEIATELVASIAAEHDTPALPLAPSAYAWLERQPLRGNIRELKHLLLSAVLWAEDEGASAISAEHFADATTDPQDVVTADDLKAQVDAFRCRHVRRVLEACGGNRKRAAEALGVNRTYLYELLERYGLSDLPDTSADAVGSNRRSKSSDRGRS